MRRIRINWKQYRLRPLLVVLALISIWLGVISQRARRQKYVADQTRALGGDLLYDYEKQKGGRWNEFDYTNPPPGPAWLRKFVGEDYFQTIVQIGLHNTRATNSDLKFLDSLPDASDIESIDLGMTKISDDALVHIERFRNLKGLVLSNTQFDDRGIVYIRKLTNLRALLLDGTNVTDAGIVDLQGLVNLEDWLGLSDTAITDASIKYFKNFKKLREINLLGTKVTERGARELKQSLPQLRISYSRGGQNRSL